MTIFLCILAFIAGLIGAIIFGVWIALSSNDECSDPWAGAYSAIYHPPNQTPERISIRELEYLIKALQAQIDELSSKNK